MEELYIETINGNIPIDMEIIKKFKLEKGTYSPFTHSRIIGKNGEFPIESSDEEDIKSGGKPAGQNDDKSELENDLLFSTSEIIDLARGEDSTAGQ